MASGANIADQPSRGEFALLTEFGSTEFEIRWPDLTSPWAGLFTQIFDEFAPRPSNSEKRARQSIERAIEEERATKRRRE